MLSFLRGQNRVMHRCSGNRLMEPLENRRLLAGQVVTLPEFSGPELYSGFPAAPLTVGTFSFDVEEGGSVGSARIYGEFGNSIVDNTAALQLYLDGVPVAQAAEFATHAWSYDLSESDLEVLDDGQAVLTVVQTSSAIIRLAPTTLEIDAAEVDIRASQLDWNLIDGGLDYSYEVTGGALEESVLAVLYWATGPNAADTTTSVYSFTIPSGTEGTVGPTRIPGNVLRSAPIGTTHLALLIDPENQLSEKVEDNNSVSIQDVQITYGGNPPARQILSDYTLGIIKDALRYAGEPSAEINSTYRTPEEQADEMLTIINGPKGLNEAKRLYSGVFGRQVLSVYENEAKEYDKELKNYRKNLAKYQQKPQGQPPQAPVVPDYRALMAATIAQIVASNPDTAFAHTRDFSRWNTVDIRFASVDNQTLFHEALTTDGRISKVLDPFNSSDRAFHIEVRLI